MSLLVEWITLKASIRLAVPTLRCPHTIVKGQKPMRMLLLVVVGLFLLGATAAFRG